MNREDIEYLNSIPLCKLHPLRLYEQEIEIKTIKDCLTKTYDNVAFSTIPYKLYNITSSKVLYKNLIQVIVLHLQCLLKTN